MEMQQHQNTYSNGQWENSDVSELARNYGRHIYRSNVETLKVEIIYSRGKSEGLGMDKDNSLDVTSGFLETLKKHIENRKKSTTKSMKSMSVYCLCNPNSTLKKRYNH